MSGLRVAAGPATRLRLPTLRYRHGALIVLLAVAAALRALAVVAIYPGIWFPDTGNYVRAAATGELSPVRVDGYALFLAPFVHFANAGSIIIVQHLLGLGVVVLLYAFLLRRGVPTLLAVLASLPAALDGYLIDLEHSVMSDTIFTVTMLGAIAVLLWKGRPTIGMAAASGLLLGYAGTVRSIAVPFIAAFVVYLLIRRVGAYRLVAFCVCWLLVIAGYLTVFHAQHGEFAFTTWSGRYLYSRVATFADCGRLPDLPKNERALCPDPRHRLTQNNYLWSEKSPINQLPDRTDPRISDFAHRVVTHQTGAYVRSVAGDLLHYFEPGHRIGPNDYNVHTWQFPARPGVWHGYGYRGPLRHGNGQPRQPGPLVSGLVDTTSTNVGASRFLHYYQRYFYTSGQVLAVCVLLTIAGLVWRPRRGWRHRLDAALLASVAVIALAVAAALSVFSYRYGLVAIVPLSAAAVLAVHGLRQTGAELSSGS